MNPQMTVMHPDCNGKSFHDRIGLPVNGLPDIGGLQREGSGNGGLWQGAGLPAEVLPKALRQGRGWHILR